MMDSLLETKEKRFIAIFAIYSIIMVFFLYGVFQFSRLLLSIESSQQLMILTNPANRDLYWPVDAIAKIMDLRLNFMNVFNSILQSIPFSFYVGLFCIIYLGSSMFDKKHHFYKYQQGILIFTFVLIVFQFAIILSFLNGFLGGSVASAIQRIHISGYVGYVSSIVLVILFIVLFVKLVIDYLDINQKE